MYFELEKLQSCIVS